MKVCEKVKAKGTTSYNEVADELVAELTDPRCEYSKENEVPYLDTNKIFSYNFQALKK